MCAANATRPHSWARLALVLRWIARLASVASVALLAAFAFGEPAVPTLPEAVALVFFPLGVVVGMALGWWREGLGGLVTAGSLAAFYAWMMFYFGNGNLGPYFLIFSAPGLLFGICALLERMRRHGVQSLSAAG